MPRLASVIAIILLAPALAGCLGTEDVPDDAPDASAARWSPSEWKSALTEPVYEGVARSVHYVTAEDGTQLALTLHLPEGLPDGKRVPTLLEITPYQPLGNAFYGDAYTPATGFTGDGPGASWRDFVLRGAAYVTADARGTGASEGCLDFGGEADRADARTFTTWIREQAWSDGRVVTDGVSHPGMGSVVAHVADADLTAALAHAPVVSYYQDEWLQGAKFENQFNGPGYQAIEAAPAPWGDPDAVKAQAASCTGETTVDFTPVEGPFTDLWAERDLSRHVNPEQDAPILLTHGFLDENVHVDHFQKYWDALPEDHAKHAILGWWYHSWPHMGDHPASTGDAGGASFTDLRHRWLDATLFGVENGLDAEPRVLVQDSRGTWHESHDWPLDGSDTVTLHATADGALAADADAQGEVSYPDEPGARRGEWAGASAVFRTDPFPQTRLVNGAPAVDLVASSTADATKWVAYLLDEAPDGSWNRVTHGYADSHSHGEAHEWLPMEPGTPYTWQLNLMPTAVVVEEGHRLVLVIASQDSARTPDENGNRPCFDDYRGGCHNPSGIVPADTAGRAVNTVHTGPEGTRVTVDWVDPSTTAKPPW